MIRVNVNGKELVSFKTHLWRYKDIFFLRLREIDISTSNGVVIPVYMPLFRVEQHPGQLCLSVFFGGYEYALIFGVTDPFVAYEKYKSVKEEKIDQDQV